MNTGSMLTESGLTDAVGGEVVWNVLEDNLDKIEKTFGKVTLPRAAGVNPRERNNGRRRGRGRVGGSSNKTRRWRPSCFGGGDDSDSDSDSGRRCIGGAGASRRGGDRRLKTVVGTPPGAPANVKGRAAIMVHGTKGLSYRVGCCSPGAAGGGDLLEGV